MRNQRSGRGGILRRTEPSNGFSRPVEMKPFSRRDLESHNLLIQKEYCGVRRPSLWVVQAVNQSANRSVRSGRSAVSNG